MLCMSFCHKIISESFLWLIDLTHPCHWRSAPWLVWFRTTYRSPCWFHVQQLSLLLLLASSGDFDASVITNIQRLVSCLAASSQARGVDVGVSSQACAGRVRCVIGICAILPVQSEWNQKMTFESMILR